MHITELLIKDYQGIEFLKLKIPELGGVFEGTNAVGKTSAVDAIFAALIARGTKPENIRVGADRSEILVKLGDTKVKRTISRDTGTNITMVPSAAGAGAADRLRALLKPASLNPLSFYLDKDNRRKILLDAMPISVTAADIERWTGEPAPQGTDFTRHGLVVVSEVRGKYFDARTEAKKKAKDARAAAEAAATASLDAMMVAGAQTTVTVKDADEDLVQARAAKSELDGRRAAAATAAAGTAEVRGRIAAMVARAAELELVRAPTGDLLAGAAAMLEAKERDVEALRIQLRTAEEAVVTARADRDALIEGSVAAERARQEAVSQRQQAAALETSLAAMHGAVVSDEDLVDAAAAVTAREEIATFARAAADARRMAGLQDAEERKLGAAEAEVERLEGIVQRMTDVAPLELAGRGAIPGIDFEAMTLDGVPLSTLNGAKQLAFSVDLAKRLGGEIKVLVVDGLERIDTALFEDFVKMATSGGWQLIGTKVTDGKALVFHAIE